MNYKLERGVHSAGAIHSPPSPLRGKASPEPFTNDNIVHFLLTQKSHESSGTFEIEVLVMARDADHGSRHLIQSNTPLNMPIKHVNAVDENDVAERDTENVSRGEGKIVEGCLLLVAVIFPCDDWAGYVGCSEEACRITR